MSETLPQDVWIPWIILLRDTIITYSASHGQGTGEADMARTYLNVPYQRRGEAKRAGATWDEERHRWYVEDADIPASLSMFRMGSLDGDGVATVSLYTKSPFSRKKGFVASVAKAVRCPRQHECQLACGGQCLALGRWENHQSPCPWASVERIEQDKRDRGFDGWVRGHPRYEALSKPDSRRFAIVGDDAYLALQFADIKRSKSENPERAWGALGDSGYVMSDANMFMTAATFVPLSVLTPANIDRIAKFRPCNLFGDVISAYRRETVPTLLDDIRRHWPEGWDALVAEFPEYAGNEVDYRGREAFLSTCREGAEFRARGDGAPFVLRDGRLVCESLCGFGSPLPVVGSWKGARVEIPVTDDMRVKITDNAQVDPDRTRFA